MNAYEQKQERRRERLEARADRLSAESAAKFESGMSRLRAIPFGQPILIGHHSERRDRNYRRKAIATVDKSFELRKAAGEAAARAAAVGTGGISSDDPDATTKLREQLEAAEQQQETMKAANAAWRKEGNKAGRQPDGSWADGPYASYQLTNNSANIRRIKARIEQLERDATRETKETERSDGIRIVENAEANRLQIFFPAKPSAETRTILKRSGFRWSPSEGAWQRHLNAGARAAAEYALRSISNLPAN